VTAFFGPLLAALDCCGVGLTRVAPVRDFGAAANEIESNIASPKTWYTFACFRPAALNSNDRFFIFF
jgi:hypothetical protein